MDKNKSMSVIKNSSPRVLECIVCGKVFTRGPVDLARHQNSKTLKHLFSTKSSDEFPFGCRKCDNFFGSKEHLTSHRAFSSCCRLGSKNSVVPVSPSSNSKPTKQDLSPRLSSTSETDRDTKEILSKDAESGSTRQSSRIRSSQTEPTVATVSKDSRKRTAVTITETEAKYELIAYQRCQVAQAIECNKSCILVFVFFSLSFAHGL